MHIVECDDGLSADVGQEEVYIDSRLDVKGGVLVDGAMAQVEAVREAASRLLAEREGAAAPPVLATHVDWYLWRWGEERRADAKLPPFHRCRTVFY